MPRLFSALPIVLALAVLCLSPAVQAADPMFTVGGVHVAAAAASAGEAQSIALTQGRPRAWQTLYRRLTRQQDWGKQPQLDDTALQRLVRNFTVTHERRSTTRYEADISYDFNPIAVGKLLKQSSIAFAQAGAKRILLIPMNPTFSKASPWSHAFMAPRFADAIVPFALPIGDALDNEALGNLTLDRASWMDIEPIAQRAHASEAVLVLAAPNNGKLTLTFKRIGASESPMTSTVDVPYVQSAVTTYPAAADAAMNAIADLWKQKSAVDFGQKGKLTADVRISSLSQWANVQAALASVPNVSSVNIVAMNIGEARIALGYMGTADQLKDALGQASLQLDEGSSGWVLRQGAPPAQPATTASQ